MLQDAIDYTTDSDFENYLVGGVLVLLLVTAPIVWGYYIKICRETANGSESPPDILDCDIGGLFKDGLVYLLISIIYMALPTLLMFLGMMLLFTSGDALDVALGAIAVGGVLQFVAGYVMYAGVLNYATTGSVRAAFQWSDIREIIFEKQYVVAVVLIFAVSLILGLGAAIISLIPFLGWVLAPIISFIMGILMWRIIATAFTDITTA